MSLYSQVMNVKDLTKTNLHLRYINHITYFERVCFLEHGDLLMMSQLFTY